MSESFTFFDSSGRFQITVHKKFKIVCPNPCQYYMYALNNVYSLSKYLHNKEGPAILDTHTMKVQFWVDGKPMEDREGKKMEHNFKFGNKVLDILGD